MNSSTKKEKRKKKKKNFGCIKKLEADASLGPRCINLQFLEPHLMEWKRKAHLEWERVDEDETDTDTRHLT